MSTTAAAPRDPQTTAPPQAGAGAPRTSSLGHYLAPDTGQEREVLRIQRPNGSALVVDYELGTLSDGRLVAHLAPDEPAENAQVVCDLYLADGERRGRCRAVAPEDFDATRHVTPSQSIGDGPTVVSRLQDVAGHVYRISELPLAGASLGDSRRELRWTRSLLPGRDDACDAVTLRDVVGSLEAYEPARTLTHDAIARFGRCVSTRRLREELERLAESSIVLNRGLREAVQRELRLGVVTRSEIALRCDRVRRESAGGCSGDTSWLARRIGEMPEGGEEKPCPWIQTDVLALIARDGLGISPREVEL
ncbi:MAG TPA: hypothetical protein VFW38_07720 [Solirubrobacteraceae bacterium]|nr:hypothetical protein [Solirubrobacteraceae bacterium]